jgi:hypothetical protein
MPLIFATGAGAEMRQAMGTAVFFGMLGVTVFGVFFTPVFYTVIRKVFPGKAHPALDRPPAGTPSERLPSLGAAPHSGNGHDAA